MQVTAAVDGGVQEPSTCLERRNFV